MTLSPREQHILALTGLRADCSLRELARHAGCQLHTMRYALDRLRERGVIHKVWIIDLLRLGWLRFQIFFSTGIQKSQIKSQLIAFLKQSEQIAFLAETGGDFDYEMVLMVRDIAGALEFLREVTGRFGDVFLHKAIVSHQRVTFFPRKYLAQRKLRGELLVMGGEGGRVAIDEVDHRILSALAREPDITQREMARRLGCSEPTIKTRIRALSDNKVIAGAVYAVDASTFGAQNHILLLSVKGFEPKLRADVFDFARNHPHCTNIRECFGSWDYEMGVEVRRYAELVSFKEELGERFGASIQRLEVLSRFKVHKYLLYPFAPSPSNR